MLRLDRVRSSRLLPVSARWTRLLGWVWPGGAVEDIKLTGASFKPCHVVDGVGLAPSRIKTVLGRGYINWRVL